MQYILDEKLLQAHERLLFLRKNLFHGKILEI